MKHLLKRIRRPWAAIIAFGAIGFFFQLFLPTAMLAQENAVESFSISSRAVSAGGSGVGTINVIFTFSFSKEIRDGDIESVKLTGSGTDLSPAIKKAGKWDHPTKSQLRLIVPLPEIMAVGAAFGDNSTSISFSTQINLRGNRKQKASAEYDFVVQEEKIVKPEINYGNGVMAISKAAGSASSSRKNSDPTSPATSAGTTGSEAAAAEEPTSPASGADFPSGTLPDTLAQRSSPIGPEGGGVSLPSGARIEIPPGALAKTADITLRKLKSHVEDMELYHMDAGGAPLAAPATVVLPLPSRPGNQALAVDILHFQDLEDRGTLLPATWRPGDKEVTVQTKKFCIMGMVIVWSGITYVAGRIITIKTVSNTPQNFAAAVDAAINAAGNKSIVLPSTGYNQFPPNTMWCWSSSLSALLQTARSLRKHLADPVKPQSLAGLWGYNRSGYVRTGPSAVEWLNSDSGLFTTLGSKADAQVEARCFARYPALAIYLISQIDQGYPVTLDIHSRTHMVNIVGYDHAGPFVHDPASRDQPYHASWGNFYDVINKGVLLTGNFALTTVIKRDVRNNPPLYGINLPSCEFNAASSAHVNENGLYFTLPTRGAHAGFKWDGKAERYGMQLIAGQPEGPDEEPLAELLVGYGTRIGEKSIEVTNSTDHPVPASIRLDLMDGRTRRTLTAAKQDVSLEPMNISRHDLPATALYPLLQKEFPSSGSILARTVLVVGGEEKDMVLALFRYRLFALSSASAIASAKAGESQITLKGSGLSRGEMDLIVEIPDKEPVTIAVPSTASDTEKSMTIGQSIPALRDAKAFLRLRSPGSATVDAIFFDRAGLETNRVPVITGGSLKEVSTADDPERDIPPPPTEPLKKK